MSRVTSQLMCRIRAARFVLPLLLLWISANIDAVAQNYWQQTNEPYLQTKAKNVLSLPFFRHDVSSGSDKLIYDDGNDTADGFVGFGLGSDDFYWLNNFVLSGFDFRLESFEFYIRTESASNNPVYLAVLDSNSQILVEGNVTLNVAPNGEWYMVTLNNPLTFNNGQRFSLLVSASRAIPSPAGVDVDATVRNNSFYFDPDSNKYVNLNTIAGFEDGAFLIRAVGTKTVGGNQLPIADFVFDPIPPSTINPVRFTSTSFDPDGQITQYSWNFGDGTAEVSGPNLVTVQHIYIRAGVYVVTLRVTDNLNLIGRKSREIRVFLDEGSNRPPEVANPIPSQTLTAGGAPFTVSFTRSLNAAPVVFTDPDGDGDRLIYASSSSAPGIATANISGSLLIVTPVASGSATITVTANDERRGSTQTTFIVTVNRSPVVTNAIPNQIITVGSASFTRNLNASPAVFSDPDGDVLTYTASSSEPSVASVGISGNVLTVSPVAVGSVTIIVTANDGRGGMASTTFTIAVNGPPTVATNSATNVGSTSATLNGAVNPNNLSTTVKFQYGTTTSYGSEITAIQSPVTGATAVTVSAALTGLFQNTLYHYRVVGTNSAGTISGADGMFTTPGSPTVITDAATNVGTNSVTLNGTVNPNNISTTVKFQYGTTTSYGGEVAATPSPVNGATTVAVSAAVAGLSQNTLYHYRVVGTNSAGITNGGDGTFITAGSPTVSTNAATNLSTSSATLNGTIIPNGLSTTVKFQYGTTTSYGSEISATPSPVSGTNAVSVSAMLTGLAANALFHYRVIGTNSAGTTNGDDQTFTTTTTGNVPAVTTNAATNIGTTSATLNGTVNSNGLSTSVKFEYGTTTNYSTEATATPNPITGPSAVAINAMITGLTPNVTYHYRAVGTNSAGTTNGGDQTFTTVIDQAAPNISHTAIASAPSGQSQTIAAILIDNIGIQSAVLNYRMGGASAYTAVAMSKTSGDNYQGAILSGSITERGVEYYISAQDAAGNKATFPTTNAEAKPQVIQVTNSNLPFLVSTPVKAYRMISIPFDLNDRSAASVLQDDFTGAYDQTLWRLLRYVNPTTNIEFGASGFPDFAPGAGFWLITKEAKRLDAGAGRSVTTAKNYVITLQPGWNQIGNPFAFTMNWSDVMRGANVENRLVGYQGQRNEATGYDYTRTQMDPFEGYFVNNKGSSPTTIEIKPIAASGSAAAKPVADWKSALQSNEWALQITAACDRYLDKDNYLGGLNDAVDEWDANDFSEAPFFDQHVALYFPHSEWKKYPDLYTGDFRAVKPEGDYWDFFVKSEIAKSEVARSEVVLRLAEVQNLPAEWEIVLLDKASRVAINFSEKKQYTFPSGGGKSVREFRVVVGKKDFVETNNLNLSGVPQAFALGQNYPNPFSPHGRGTFGNPSTRIDYELPFTNHVKISVYNVSGQLVRTLFDGEQSVGRYTVLWDGMNTIGERVSSGVYLVRMTAGRFVAVRKAALAK